MNRHTPRKEHLFYRTKQTAERCGLTASEQVGLSVSSHARPGASQGKASRTPRKVSCTPRKSCCSTRKASCTTRKVSCTPRKASCTTRKARRIPKKGQLHPTQGQSALKDGSVAPESKGFYALLTTLIAVHLTLECELVSRYCRRKA